MQPWPAPPIPALPGPGRLPRVFDTATSSLVEVGSAAGASMYVCGITPYDATHVGHAATYVAFDLLNRVWRDAGVDVQYVQNVTDVDDPLLERATATGEAWGDLAARGVQLFRDDMTALRVVPPGHYVGVVESLPEIVAMVSRLRDAGVVYDVDGDVYFSIEAAPRFGTISHTEHAAMLDLFAERGGDPDRPGKKNVLDALLWRLQRPGEPGWESPFGRGRPGWHAECAAIALEYLPVPIDVQGGGSDLVFPHHEMSAAQACAATGEAFARAYVHAGMVAYRGEKMSKSLGNLVFVSRLRESGVDPMAVRLALLAHHYRTDWEWMPADLDAAGARLARWRAALSAPGGPPARQLVATMRERLADDLDAPGAVAAVDEWVAAVGREDASSPASGSEAPTEARAAIDALLGVKP